MVIFPRWAILSLFTVPAAGAAMSADPYQPLAFLVGHCWKGELPGGKQSDEHCFSWIYDKKFVRDVHVARGGDSRRPPMSRMEKSWLIEVVG